MAIVQAYQADLLRDLDSSDAVGGDIITELRSSADLALRATKETARCVGRSMAALVATERHLWLNPTDIKEREKAFLLDAPLSPGGLFGDAVHTVTESALWGPRGQPRRNDGAQAVPAGHSRVARSPFGGLPSSQMHEMTTAAMTTTVNESTENITFIDSEFRYTLFPIFYGVVFVLGLLANCYALYVLHYLRESKAMNEIRIYMTNLTIADLLFVSALPFWIGYYVEKGDWKYTDALCRITGSLFFINTYCSILFLTAISINRYWAVTRPLVAASSDCWKRAVIVSTVIWVLTLAASVKFLTEEGIPENKNGTNTSDKKKDIRRCFEGYQDMDKSAKWSLANIHFVIIGLFFLVFTMVIFCNILIARALLSQPISQPRASTGKRPGGTKRRALRLLCAVVGVFVICFLPHHVVQGPWTLSVLYLNKWSMETRQSFNDAHQITLMLMGINCLLDPLVYCFATTKFRKYIKGHFTKVKNNRNCSRNTLSSAISLKSRYQGE
ncbi:platelet-activating factor receptor-like [Pseudorasbora parva]|uniref:platelet-activating factor receptor-like n=1 Tax=Pseudorasbora parva TaxID=51549 RepID=UPI00351F348D